ncbi:hypothetical protein ACLB1T_19670 [Escherichia coli]
MKSWALTTSPGSTGHHVLGLITTLKNMRDLKGPQFLHIMTKKGRGVMNRQKKTPSLSTPCLKFDPLQRLFAEK